MEEPVTIEPASLAHASALHRLIAEPEVAEPTSNIPHPYPVGGAAAWITDACEQWAAGTAYSFAILVAGEFVGSCSITGIENGEGEIGYWLGKPYWGRGYMTSAGTLLLQYAFNEGGLVRVIGRCLKRNEGSYRVLAKLGFEHTGFGEVSKPKWPSPEQTAEFQLSRECWIGQIVK